MANRRSLAVCTALLCLVISTELVAQNGKPFRQIQTQLAAMNTRIVALQTQINSIEASLQAQIDSLNASFVPLQAWMDSVDAALASIDSRIDANEGMIAAIQDTIGSLQASLVAVEMDLASLRNQVAANSGDVDANAAAILALQTQAAQLRSLIDQHTSQISGLQGQVTSANTFLANMANATCAVGQAISDIQPFGQITCMTPAAGGVQVFGSQFVWAFGPGAHTFVVNCPLGSKAAGGGYDGAFGVAVTGSFPNATSYVVRVQSTLASASIQALVKCVQ